MRFFPLVDLQYAVLALLLGALGLVLTAAAWGGYPRRRGGPPEAPDAEPAAEENPVPPLLLFVYAAAAAGCVGYAVFAGVLGGPLGY